jgi:predicted molibdopterin-dependent oxidoreductase YjgC
MTQEVRVVLTLEVDIKETKEDIISNLHCILPHLIRVNEVEEESEIYKTETISSVTNCPTCGAECSVEGDTTHYYVPKNK